MSTVSTNGFEVDARVICENSVSKLYVGFCSLGANSSGKTEDQVSDTTRLAICFQLPYTSWPRRAIRQTHRRRLMADQPPIRSMTDEDRAFHRASLCMECD